jgi:hypothetical protein
MTGLNDGWKSGASEAHRFSRPASKLTRADLETYAQELNEGPMKGWYVKREMVGGYERYTLGRY